MLTGLRAETFENLQLNAGVFLSGFSPDAIADAAALRTAAIAAIQSGEGLLGATRGGGSFECTPQTRTVEADGMRYPFVGSTVNDLWTVKLKTTLLEVTPDNFERALICADVKKEGKKTIIRVRTGIAREDYIPSICWIGDTSRGFVMIQLDNALNLTGATFTFTDKGEGTLPVEFQAHNASLEDQDHAPFRIIFFDQPEGVEEEPPAWE